MARLTSTNVRLAHHESLCGYVIALADFIEKELETIKSQKVASSNLDVDLRSEILIDHNAYLQNWTRCLSRQFDDLRKRTSGMTQAVRSISITFLKWHR